MIVSLPWRYTPETATPQAPAPIVVMALTRYTEPMITIICEICGRSFQVKNYRAKTARFCSQQCGGVWHAKNRLAQYKHTFTSENAPRRYGQVPPNAFQAGDTPWNKGKKGIHCSPDTEFKKGYISHKRVPVGTVRIYARKNRDDVRAFIKTAEPNTWKLRSVAIWEAVNGPIPRGKVIHHIDEDTLNDTIENLQLLSRAEHLKVHS